MSGEEPKEDIFEEDAFEEDCGVCRNPRGVSKARLRQKPAPPNSYLFGQVVRICGFGCNWSEKTSGGIQTVTFTGLRDIRASVGKALELLGRKFRLVKVGDSSASFQQKFELSEENPEDWVKHAAETQVRLQKALLESLRKPAYVSESPSINYDTYSANEVACFINLVSRGHNVRVVRRIWNKTFKR